MRVMLHQTPGGLLIKMELCLKLMLMGSFYCFGATKARQVSSHPKWIKKRVPGTAEMTITPVLITPCRKAKSGADPHLEDVRYWGLEEFREWAAHAIAVLRDLKGTYPGEADLVWKAEAASRLEAESLTLASIVEVLPAATEAMEIVR